MKSKSGFTLVELLIVIVVIAILVTISIVTYAGIQDRANDTKVKSGVNQIEKALQIWYARTGEQPRGGWGSSSAISGSNCADGSGGWASSGVYSCALEDILHAEHLLPANFVYDLPHNTNYSPSIGGRYTLMFYPCGSGTGRYALYWHLRNPTAADTASLTKAESQGCPPGPRTSYGMKAATVLTFM